MFPHQNTKHVSLAFFFLRPHSYRHPDNNAHYGIVLLVSVLTRVHCTVIGMSCQLLILTSMYMWQKFTNNRRSHIMINLYLRYNDVYKCQLADVKNMKRNLVSQHFFLLVHWKGFVLRECLIFCLADEEAPNLVNSETNLTSKVYTKKCLLLIIMPKLNLSFDKICSFYFLRNDHFLPRLLKDLLRNLLVLKMVSRSLYINFLVNCPPTPPLS